MYLSVPSPVLLTSVPLSSDQGNVCFRCWEFPIWQQRCFTATFAQPCACQANRHAEVDDSHVQEVTVVLLVVDDAGDGHNSIVLISVQIPFLHKKSVLLLIHTWKRLPRKYYDTTPYRVTHCGLTQNMVQRAIFQAKMRECSQFPVTQNRMDAILPNWICQQPGVGTFTMDG